MGKLSIIAIFNGYVKLLESPSTPNLFQVETLHFPLNISHPPSRRRGALPVP